jgi:hypothetical protein
LDGLVLDGPGESGKLIAGRLPRSFSIQEYGRVRKIYKGQDY